MEGHRLSRCDDMALGRPATGRTSCSACEGQNILLVLPWPGDKPPREPRGTVCVFLVSTANSIDIFRPMRGHFLRPGIFCVPPYACRARTFSTSRKMPVHHLMIGTWTPPGAIFTVAFDDEKLTLELMKRTEIPQDEPISWMAFDVSQPPPSPPTPMRKSRAHSHVSE